MSNCVITLLKKEAEENSFTLFSEIFGELCLSDSAAIKQSSGAVYGILAESDSILGEGVKAINPDSNLYPVYWGKDIAPVSRLKAHVQNHQSTGNANLRSREELVGKHLFFGAILVSRYTEFEAHLHSKYPPMIGTGARGRVSQIIEIRN
ncbi:hypothetical protein [Rhodoferax sp.]|uniref:hypothetical protein n=1 Tax=Rhodoferax sp. TaxID=50421 RepID=UPI0026071AE3|nr:hypothetical protein [Rhodoferax sp.]MDD2810262.1 hypothetical protein [Rhodoferax sp.]